MIQFLFADRNNKKGTFSRTFRKMMCLNTVCDLKKLQISKNKVSLSLHAISPRLRLLWE